MKVVLAGGGTGGHFYPLMAVADKIREVAEERHMIQPKIFYFSDAPYDEERLFNYEVEFRKITAGKLRLYPSFKNIIDFFKVIWGVLDTTFRMFQIMPDVIFSNGGYAAFPTLVAARILRIPVVIHVSDTVPSRVLLFAGKFATKISLAFSEAERYFSKQQDKIAILGNPIRDEIKYKQKDGAHQFFGFDPNIPTIWILGGSLGSKIINDTIIGALPDLIKKYNIIHQTGRANFNDVYGMANVTLLNNQYKNRYRVYEYLDDLKIKMSAGASNLVIARSGANSVFEIANWGLPSILIPLSKTISRDQVTNSLAYAKTGSAVVVRQRNLTPHLLMYEINKLFKHPEKLKEMSENAHNFFVPDAEVKIAEAILNILMKHQA